MGTLSTRGRNRLKDSDFAIPEERKYPIHDLAHARNALARVAQHGTPEEQRRVRAAVYAKYPQLKPGNKSVEVEWTGMLDPHLVKRNKSK